MEITIGFLIRMEIILWGISLIYVPNAPTDMTT